jgi:STE24 endopeptidase
MILLLAVAALSFPLMRLLARRAEKSDGEPVDRLHRLRRSSTAMSFGWMLVVLVGAQIELRSEQHHVGGPGKVVFWAVAVVIAVGSLLSLSVASRPSIERIRGIEGTTRHYKRRLLRSLVILVPMLLWVVGLQVLVHSDVNPVVAILLMVVGLMLLFSLAPLAVLAAIPNRPAAPEVNDLVLRICDTAGVRIRGVRILDTANSPAANAAVTGLGFGPKYVLLTDRLVETFSPDELEAVVAHEVGHLKKHHIARKTGWMLGTTLGLFAVIVAAFVLADQDLLPRWVSVTIAVLSVALLFVSRYYVRGRVGIRYEEQADDYAVSVTSAASMRDALEKLTEQNMMKRRTGRVWNILTQHPGMTERIERLDPTPATAQASDTRSP